MTPTTTCPPRRAGSLAFALVSTAALLLTLSGCPKKQTTPPPPPPTSRPATKPPPPPPGKGRIVIDCTPDDAEVTVDGVSKGTVRDLGKRIGLEVDLGVRRVEVRKRGYQPFRIEIKLGERPEYLRVRLKRAHR